MGRSARQLISLTLACAFSSCFAEVALGVELSPETTSFHQMAASAQPLSLYHSSPHQSTTVHFTSTGSLQTTPMGHRTAEQTPEQLQATSAAGQHTAARAGAGTTAPADSPGQATSPAMPSLTAAVKNTTTPPVSSTSHGKGPRVTTGTAAVATNTSLKHDTGSTQGAGATSASAGPSTRSRRQTTATGAPTATALTNTTGTHAGTQTAPTSPASTVRPPPTPQPSAIPTGTYTVSDGNGTCVKAVMGLQLMGRNTQQMEYVTVNPNATKISGSCGMVQSELSLTFSGGFVNITFVKQASSYSVTKIESRIQFSSEGMLYYAALNEKLFTTKLGNSFKCASRQTFPLEKNFQILFVHMQLQAFDIVGDQFGKEEECFLDRNGRVAPIAVCLCILGLFVIVFATFLISRRKPQRGYERI
ncbi:lysosome-associated membrane glycoprotein 3 isoform X2 [Passer montanus]|uniref:lysosome-associated membrane glycoprotein 3 isoform X2 n=1 Tax=Passer montanus TaxID=9160 RepID=UPI00195FBE0D|nr:lysosome-associated membrane glycoprotein 3 isoform X2 [Passer montanus]